jgi:hypothetical protein
VTRPTFVSVDKKATPPTMTLCFEGQPPRYVTINIRGDTKARDATYLGVTQLRDFTADQIALLDAVARPREAGESDVTTILVLDGDDLQPLPNVLVHCPACCANLGNLTTPHVYSVRKCSACGRGVEVRYALGVLTVRLTVG